MTKALMASAVLVSFCLGLIFGFIRFIDFAENERTMRGYLLVADNNRLKSGQIEDQIRLNDIEIAGALGAIARREPSKEHTSQPEGYDYKETLQMFLSFLGHDRSRTQEMVEISEQAMIEYYRNSPVPLINTWTCEDLDTETGRAQCQLHNKTKLINEEIQSYVEKN